MSSFYDVCCLLVETLQTDILTTSGQWCSDRLGRMDKVQATPECRGPPSAGDPRVQGTPECRGPPSSRQNPLHDNNEFYVQCEIKFLHERENFRLKPLKGNGRGRIREGKERGPPGYFVQPPPPPPRSS